MSRNHDDDIDAEFRTLIAELGDIDASGSHSLAEHTPVDHRDPLAGSAPASPTSDDAAPRAGDASYEADHAESAPAADASDRVRDALDVPVDEALHLEGGRLSVALVLAPLPSPEALHSLLALSGIRESVVRLKPWTGVWLRVETQPTGEEELEELLTGKRAMPDEVDRVARVVSRLSKYGSVALMSWLVEGEGVEPGVSGRISAQRYVNGQPEDDIPAGLLLGAMPQATEDLLLGRTVPQDYPDSVSADGRGGRSGPFSWLKRR